MMFDPEDMSRAAAVRALAAALKAPMSWSGLNAMARALAGRLPVLEGDPLELAPDFRQRLLGLAPEPSNPPQAAASSRAAVQAMLLMLEMAAVGSAEAMARCATAVAALPDALAVFGPLGAFLDAAPLGRDLDPDSLVAAEARAAAAAPPGIHHVLARLIFLGLSRNAPFAGRSNAFHHLAAARMRAAAARGDVDELLSIEREAYEAFVKSVETPEHHTAALRVIEEACALLPEAPPPRPARPPSAGRPPKVAFLIYNGVMLAHTEVLLSFLAGHAQLAEPLIEPLVVIYGATHGGPLGDRLEGMGVAWRTVGLARPLAYEDMYIRTGETLAAEGVEEAVFVSLPMHLAYLCRRPVSPVQTWWSMKFPLPNFEPLQGRVFYRSLFDSVVQVEGRRWRGGPLAINPPAPPDPAAVAAIRARYPGQRILGTVAREEKIAHPGYLAAVVDILQQRPDACFLWTGRTPLAAISRIFEEGGVGDRCHFVGWVDPATYLAAFDLFLETYPLTGLTTAWAMSLGKPAISVGEMGFVGCYLAPLFDGAYRGDPEVVERVEAIFAPVRGRLPGLWAKGPEEIALFAKILLDDPALAAELGRAQQAYLQAFLSDPAGSAAAQARHFAAIAAENRARGSREKAGSHTLRAPG